LAPRSAAGHPRGQPRPFRLPLDLEPATLGDIARPALLLWGREDKLISVANAAVFKALPKSKLIIYEQCGGLPME
jgi:pimeloyl-ACP methyl ester carboxylesterase